MRYQLVAIVNVFFSLLLLASPADASKRTLDQRIANQNVTLSPSKVGRYAAQGNAAIEMARRQQQEQAQQEEMRQAEIARKAELARQEQERLRQEAVRRAELALLEQERAQQEAIKQAKIARQAELDRQEQERLRHEAERSAALARQEQERAQQEAKKQTEIARQAEQERIKIVEAQRRFEAEGTRFIADETLRKRIEQLEAEKAECEACIISLRGGQAPSTLHKTLYVPYSGSYVHLAQLKEPDTSLSNQQTQTLQTIDQEVQSLTSMINAGSFKINGKPLNAVQKMTARRQLERLKEECETFDVIHFLNVLKEVKGQLPYLSDAEPLQKIESQVTWFEENRDRLAQAGEHSIYAGRQKRIEHLFATTREAFQSFYNDYLTEVVPNMCDWLRPVSTEGQSVQDAKFDFIEKIKTYSIPALRTYFAEPVKPFGPRSDFLRKTFLGINKVKEFDEFKEVLVAYGSIFKTVPLEDVKLVEDVLIHEFFKTGYMQAQVKLKSMELTLVNDKGIKAVLEEMRNRDVLSYNQIQSITFSEKVKENLPKFLKRKAVDREEHLMEPDIERALVCYHQIDAVCQRLHAGNPRIADFHED